MAPRRAAGPTPAPRVPPDACGGQVRACQSRTGREAFGRAKGNGMIGRLAPLLCNLAVRVLSAPRKPWGEAMEAELHYIGHGRAAISYATGCLIAAIQVRACDFETRLSAGLWS